MWALPYLPIDPKDVGRSYEAVIRVNSQSGKGGISYLMKHERHLDLPRRLQIEFSRAVQTFTDTHGGEVSADDLWEIFRDEYLPVEPGGRLEPWGRFALRGTRTVSVEDGPDRAQRSTCATRVGRSRCEGAGNGPIDAFVDALAQVTASRSRSSTTPSTRCPRAGTRRRPPTSSARSATACCGAWASTRRSRRRRSRPSSPR